LTPKQKAFAEEIARGSSKAKAYRTAYDSHGKPATQSRRGQELTKNGAIQAHIEAMKIAIEAQKYLFPAHLRALVIQQLTEKALDPSVNHAQQIKALELIGKFSDVQLFQERREVKTDTNTIDAKARLLDTLTNAIASSKTISEDKKKTANDLLNEIAKGLKDREEPVTIDQLPQDDNAQDDQLDGSSIIDTDADEIPDNEDPTHADPPNISKNGVDHMHTIPHEPPSLLSEPTPTEIEITDGEGVDNFWEQFEKVTTENTPLDDLGSHTMGDIGENNETS